MRRIDRSSGLSSGLSSALVFSGGGVLAALIPALFVARIHGHHLYGLARHALPGFTG